MRKSPKPPFILALTLALIVCATVVPIAAAQDSAKAVTPPVSDTTAKAAPPPAQPVTTPAATDTSKEVTPPAPKPSATPAVADTTKAKTAIQPPPAADTSKAATGTKPTTTTKPDTTKAATRPKEGGKPVTEAVDPKAPYKSVAFAKGEKPKIVMETTMGKIVLELWPDIAPKHCQSFVYLVNKGFYDTLTFHRIVPGFVIQGGDPLGNGTGGPGYSVPAEFSNKPHEDGVLSMARSQDPNSAGSQFFICLGRLTSLDNKYTVFGKVIEGLDVVHKIEKVKTSGERPAEPVKMTKVSVEKPN